MHYHIFNPTCDFAIANGLPTWQPNRLLHQMESDLATLSVYLSTPNDKIIVPQFPTNRYKKHLQKINIHTHEFILASKLAYIDIKADKALTIQPWGWSPVVEKQFTNLPLFTEHFNWLTTNLNKQSKYFFSRAFSKDIATHLIENFGNKAYVSKQNLPQIATTNENVLQLFKQWGKIVLKAPWSSSGRGLIFLRKEEIHPKIWEKVASIINTQGFIMVEPLLEQVLDIGLEFKIEDDCIEYLGKNFFITDQKGQYEGSYLNGFPESISPKVEVFIKNHLHIVTAELTKILQKSDITKIYTGYLGVDLLIFYDKKEQLRIHPCLEINVRTTMGHLALALEKYIHQKKQALFKIFYHPVKTFHQFCEEMEQKYPVEIVNQKLRKGFFPLTDFDETTRFGAYLLV